MKVLAINGSPKPNGNTFLALETVSKELEAGGIEVERLHIGNKPVRGCVSCFKCKENGDFKCVIKDSANEWMEKMAAADGLLIGSPVYYAGINGTLKCFLDRAFFAVGSKMRLKVGAGIVAVRRGGSSTAVDQLNKYLTISEMILPASKYWNMVHGMAPGEAQGDAEGIQVMRVLGKNMAWLMKLVDYGKRNFPPPEAEAKEMTNFIR